MKVLVTGATGFVGSHFVEHLLQSTDWDVLGVSRSLDHLANVAHLMPRLRLQLANCGDASSISQLIAGARPDAVVHLAGQASESLSWKSPANTFIENVVGEINLFQAFLEADIRPRTLIFGSATMYGLVKPDENPIAESQPFRPVSPYAVSKISADYLGYQYFLSRGVPIIRARPGNQIGPRQTSEFVVANFCQQVAEIERGRREPVLRTGNLEAIRDFTDVRDTVAAYRLLLEHGQPG